MISFVFAILATLLFFALLAAILLISTYNRLHGLHHRCEGALEQLAAGMKRRCEFLSQMTGVLSQSEGFDQKVVATINDRCHAANVARKQVDTTSDDRTAINTLIDAERTLDQAVLELRSALDAHEPLSRNEQLASLQNELSSAESRVDFSRETYNDFAAHYNTNRTQFPTRLLTSVLGFEAVPLFDTPESVPRQQQDDVKP